MHYLKILAFDGQSFAQTEVVINVINLDDNAPAASQACFEARIMENTKPDGSLITVQGEYNVVLMFCCFSFVFSHWFVAEHNEKTSSDIHVLVGMAKY